MTAEKDKQIVELHMQIGQLKNMVEAQEHKAVAAKAMIDELTNANVHLRAAASWSEKEARKANTEKEQARKEWENRKMPTEEELIKLVKENSELRTERDALKADNERQARVILAFDKALGKVAKDSGNHGACCESDPVNDENESDAA